MIGHQSSGLGALIAKALQQMPRQPMRQQPTSQPMNYEPWTAPTAPFGYGPEIPYGGQNMFRQNVSSEGGQEDEFDAEKELAGGPDEFQPPKYTQAASIDDIIARTERFDDYVARRKQLSDDLYYNRITRYEYEKAISEMDKEQKRSEERR